MASGNVASQKGKTRKEESGKKEVLVELRRRFLFLESRVLELETDVSDLKKELSTLKSRDREEVVENENVTQMVALPTTETSHNSAHKLMGNKIERKEKPRKKFETTPLGMDVNAELNTQIDTETLTHLKEKKVRAADSSSEPSISCSSKVTKDAIHSRRSSTAKPTYMKAARAKQLNKQEECLKCTTCNKIFSSKSNLRGHITLHTGESPFKCEMCFKKFGHKRTLEEHVRRHLGEKIYNCRLCKLKFVSTSNLIHHVASRHTTVRPFSCLFCTKGFVTLYDLFTHIRSHTREKPFTCLTCSTEYGKKCDLNRHMTKKSH